MGSLTTDQAGALARLGRFFYTIVPLDYQTYCSFTARVSLGVLNRLGIEARLCPCQLWCATRDGNFVLGFIDAPPVTGKWDGHVICEAGDCFIDASLAHLKAELSVAIPPVILGRRFMAPTNVIARHDLTPETTLWWHQVPAQAKTPIPDQPQELVDRYVAALITEVFEQRAASA